MSHERVNNVTVIIIGVLMCYCLVRIEQAISIKKPIKYEFIRLKDDNVAAPSWCDHYNYNTQACYDMARWAAKHPQTTFAYEQFYDEYLKFIKYHDYHNTTDMFLLFLKLIQPY